MKFKTTSAFLLAAFMLAGQPMPLLAMEQQICTRTTPYQDGETIKIGLTCEIADNDKYIDGSGYLDNFYADAVFHENGEISLNIPQIAGYVFQGVYSDAYTLSGFQESDGKIRGILSNRLLAENNGLAWIGLNYVKDESDIYQAGWNERIVPGSGGCYASFYADSDRTLKTGICVIDNNTYYFYENHPFWPDGAMAKSCTVDIGDKSYYFGADGKMQTGWIRISDSMEDMPVENWMYVDPKTGELLYKNWLNTGNARYYFGSEYSDAADTANPLSRFYMQKSKWVEDQGDKYYLNEDGTMAQNTWISDMVWSGDGWKEVMHYVDASGRMQNPQDTL